MAVRILTSSCQREHCKPLFNQLGILTIYGQFILDCIWLVKSDPNLQVNLREQCHNYDLRSKKNVDVPRCRLSKTKDSFPVLAYKLYNKLPSKFRELNPRPFKEKLKVWLKKKSFYSIDEYFEAGIDL